MAYNLGSASDSTCFLFHCFASIGNSVFQVFFNRAILIYNYAISNLSSNLLSLVLFRTGSIKLKIRKIESIEFHLIFIF